MATLDGQAHDIIEFSWSDSDFPDIGQFLTWDDFTIPSSVPIDGASDDLHTPEDPQTSSIETKPSHVQDRGAAMPGGSASNMLLAQPTEHAFDENEHHKDPVVAIPVSPTAKPTKTTTRQKRKRATSLDNISKEVQDSDGEYKPKTAKRVRRLKSNTRTKAVPKANLAKTTDQPTPQTQTAIETVDDMLKQVETKLRMMSEESMAQIAHKKQELGGLQADMEKVQLELSNLQRETSHLEAQVGAVAKLCHRGSDEEVVTFT